MPLPRNVPVLSTAGNEKVSRRRRSAPDERGVGIEMVTTSSVRRRCKAMAVLVTGAHTHPSEMTPLVEEDRQSSYGDEVDESVSEDDSIGRQISLRREAHASPTVRRTALGSCPAGRVLKVWLLGVAERIPGTVP